MSCRGPFTEVKVHTAKCSVCDQRNRSVLSKCQECGDQLCATCYERSKGAHGPALGVSGSSAFTAPGPSSRNTSTSLHTSRDAAPSTSAHAPREVDLAGGAQSASSSGNPPPSALSAQRPQPANTLPPHRPRRRCRDRPAVPPAMAEASASSDGSSSAATPGRTRAPLPPHGPSSLAATFAGADLADMRKPHPPDAVPTLETLTARASHISARPRANERDRAWTSDQQSSWYSPVIVPEAEQSDGEDEEVDPFGENFSADTRPRPAPAAQLDFILPVTISPLAPQPTASLPTRSRTLKPVDKAGHPKHDGETRNELPKQQRGHGEARDAETAPRATSLAHRESDAVGPGSAGSPQSAESPRRMTRSARLKLTDMPALNSAALAIPAAPSGSIRTPRTPRTPRERRPQTAEFDRLLETIKLPKSYYEHRDPTYPAPHSDRYGLLEPAKAVLRDDVQPIDPKKLPRTLRWNDPFYTGDRSARPNRAKALKPGENIEDVPDDSEFQSWATPSPPPSPYDSSRVVYETDIPTKIHQTTSTSGGSSHSSDSQQSHSSPVDAAPEAEMRTLSPLPIYEQSDWFQQWPSRGADGIRYDDGVVVSNVRSQPIRPLETAKDRLRRLMHNAPGQPYEMDFYRLLHGAMATHSNELAPADRTEANNMLLALLPDTFDEGEPSSPRREVPTGTGATKRGPPKEREVGYHGTQIAADAGKAQERSHGQPRPKKRRMGFLDAAPAAELGLEHPSTPGGNPSASAASRPMPMPQRLPGGSVGQAGLPDQRAAGNSHQPAATAPSMGAPTTSSMSLQSPGKGGAQSVAPDANSARPATFDPAATLHQLRQPRERAQQGRLARLKAAVGKATGTVAQPPVSRRAERAVVGARSLGGADTIPFGGGGGGFSVFSVHEATSPAGRPDIGFAEKAAGKEMARSPLQQQQAGFPLPASEDDMVEAVMRALDKAPVSVQQRVAKRMDKQRAD